jgi:hypothetical protein
MWQERGKWTAIPVSGGIVIDEMYQAIGRKTPGQP